MADNKTSSSGAKDARTIEVRPTPAGGNRLPDLSMHSFRRAKHFPHARGRFSVGAVDLGHRGGVLLRLFYPHRRHADRQDKERYVESRFDDWAGWYPEGEYAAGYVSFKYSWPVDSWRSRLAGWVARFVAGNPLSPTIRNAPISTDQERFPLVVFSHGNGGCRMTYSTLCSEVASRGFLVAAVEHGDGSASTARRVDGQTGALSWVPVRRVEGDDYGVRNEQVATRARECVEALGVMRDLNAGDASGVRVVFDEDGAFKTDSLKDRVDFSKGSTLLGHSFGGSTVIKALQLDKERAFNSAFCLDAWMFPIRFEVEEVLSATASRPLFFFNYEKFHWKRNLNTMRTFETRLCSSEPKVTAAEAGECSRTDVESSKLLVDDSVISNVATVKNAIHYVASDIPTLLSGTWLGSMMAVMNFRSWFRLPGSARESEEDKALTPGQELVLSEDAFLSFLRRQGFSPTEELSDGAERPVRDFPDVFKANRRHLIWGTRFLGEVDPDVVEDRITGVPAKYKTQ